MSSTPHPTQQVQTAYDGSALSFRALRACGWGKLLNLGEYRWLELPLLPLGLGRFQVRLARSSVELLAPRPGEKILDTGCGLGWTTAQIARSGAQVIGVDALETHVEQARDSYAPGSGAGGGQAGSPRFVRGDMRALRPPASDIDVSDGSVDAVHCLEAAFHLGPQGRVEFLAEAWRVLRPGGRLVVVDLTWGDDNPEDITVVDAKRRIRDIWQFDEFEPVQRYKQRAAEQGFVLERGEDWTARVIDRFVKVCYLLTWPGRFAPARAVLTRLYPGLRGLDLEQWRLLFEITRDHDRVRKRARYSAFVWRKPAS